MINICYYWNMSKKSYQNPRERFLSVAEARTNSVLNRLRILSNCSNKQLYVYTPEEVAKIFKTISSALEEARSRFAAGNKSKHKPFRLL